MIVGRDRAGEKWRDRVQKDKGEGIKDKGVIVIVGRDCGGEKCRGRVQKDKGEGIKDKGVIVIVIRDCAATLAILECHRPSIRGLNGRYSGNRIGEAGPAVNVIRDRGNKKTWAGSKDKGKGIKDKGVIVDRVRAGRNCRVREGRNAGGVFKRIKAKG